MSDLEFVFALSRPELLAPSVEATISRWKSAPWIEQVRVAEIDPTFAGGIDFCTRYGFSLKEAGNSIIIEARRGVKIQRAACLVPPDTRADLNGLARRHLNARQVSLLSHDQAISQTGMEYGSITVIGLPSTWPVLIDSSLTGVEQLVIGSGRLRAKLCLPGCALVEMTRGIKIDALGRST
jgi:prolyl-tRNA editing enzyme YbaK/EbsC (Cys-tRNA(Pro) deacylase)